MPNETPVIHGGVAPGFEPVRDAFADNFRRGLERGAAVAVYLDGRAVVDLWGGERAPGRAWEEDTLQLVFSTTKGWAALCVLHLVQDGRVALDAPVAALWPEFAAQGKGAVTVRQLLQHEAGLAAFAERISVEECNRPGEAAARLAAQAPEWEPGRAHGYHALTYGWLAGEVVLRAAGMSLGRYFREAIARPLGIDTHIGLPAGDEGRVSQLENAAADPATAALPEEQRFSTALLTKGSLTRRVFSNPPQVGIFNDPAVHQAEWPAANGITTARSLGRLYGAVATGAIVADAVLDDALRRPSRGDDLVLQRDTAFASGFMLPSGFVRFGPGEGFGHPGAGGSVGFADRARGLGFAYVMNRMSAGLTLDRRASSLVDAVYGALLQSPS